MDNTRIDITLPDGSEYTRKVMPNGEVRTRMRFSDGTITTITEAADWKPDDASELPWQEAHCHLGLTEVYTLLGGWAQFISLKPNICVSRLEVPGTTVTFDPYISHVVLLGPKAKIHTLLFGEKVPNSEKNNSDWWPAEDDFFEVIKTEKAVAEHVARASFK